MAQKEPKTHTDRGLLIAYYSYKKGDEMGVTVKEIEEAYRQVRQQRPRNLSDVIASCVKQGRMIESSERKSGAKSWVPTLTGERYVEAGHAYAQVGRTHPRNFAMATLTSRASCLPHYRLISSDQS
jgi:hypothetical protein